MSTDDIACILVAKADYEALHTLLAWAVDFVEQEVTAMREEGRL